MKNRKVLLTSVMSIAMLTSIATGATYALFTSEDSTDITIEAGKVSVKAAVSNLVHYTNGVKQTSGWANGGKATYENGNITIDRITPGDSVEIVIDVVNESNVSASYRTLVDVIKDDGLAKGLEISISSSKGTEEGFSGFAYHDWENLGKEGIAETVTVKISLPKEAGNEYQGKGTTLNFAVEAVQGNADIANTVDGLTVNKDGEFLITSATDLKILGANVNNTENPNNYINKTIKLTNNIDLENDCWTPIGNGDNGFSGVFDGDNHTISNYTVSVSKEAGLFGYALNGNNQIKNLTVENAYITANDYAGAILGRGYTDIDNCHVKNSTIITTPYLTTSGIYDGGAKAGGIIGQLLEGNETITNCSAENVTVYAYRDLGGVAGMIHDNNKASNNTASNVKLGYFLYDDITQDLNGNIGAVYGRVQSSATVSPAKDSAENKNFSQAYGIFDYNSLTSFANFVNSGNPCTINDVNLLTDIDLENKEWTPIGSYQNPFKGNFNGNSHTISNLFIDEEDGEDLGLFGYATGAKIENINIHNVNIHGYQCVAAIIGTLYTGSISNAHVSGNIKLIADYAYSAGIVSNGYVKVNNCSVIADNKGEITVHEKTMAGGIAGWLGEGSSQIVNCQVKNLDITAWASIGGITGLVHYNNTIDGCSVENVSLTKTRDGGNSSIGLASGNWSKKANGDYTITITNNSFSNVTINGNAIKELYKLHGSEYSSYTTDIKLVESGNTYDEITVNFTVIEAQ